MENNQAVVEMLPQNDETLTPEEQIWFPNMLRYLQLNGVGDGKTGRLQRARPVVLENFLPEEDLAALLEYTLSHEDEFHASSVANRKDDAITHEVRSYVRRSVVMGKIEQRYKDMMHRQVDRVLPEVLSELGIAPFPIKRKEAQITASNDGEFFKIHSDTSSAGDAQSRSITYVYYFYREPKPFCGGELRVYDTIMVDTVRVATLTTQTVIPLQNQIVFFPSDLQHEVLQVNSPSQQFADSRFTFNGWLHRFLEDGN